MPPMLCIPPAILDQSFPRDIEELDRASISLGVLQEMVASGVCYISLTPVLVSFVEFFEWGKVNSYPLLLDIHRLISQWLLQPSAEIRIIKVEGDVPVPHPEPVGSGTGLLVDEWKRELARLLQLHDAVSPANFFIGVACVRAFSGGNLGRYQEPLTERYFPLVGHHELVSLDDSELWVLPENLHLMLVSVASAKKNLPLLGASISKEAVGSHFKVTFPLAQRPWPLDPNNDPIPDRFLRQLPPLVNLPLEVIRFILIYGQVPEKRSKL